jgi:hypothetical protein
MSGLTNLTKAAALDAITIALNITAAEHAGYLGPRYPLSNLLNHKRDQIPMMSVKEPARPGTDWWMVRLIVAYVFLMLFIVVVVTWACIEKMKRTGDSDEMKALWEELTEKDD